MDYILKVVEIATIIKEVNMLAANDLVVHWVLDSLSLEYERLKISYTTIRDKWSTRELITVCVEEENKLNKKRVKKVHLTTTMLKKRSNNSSVSWKRTRNNSHSWN